MTLSKLSRAEVPAARNSPKNLPHGLQSYGLRPAAGGCPEEPSDQFPSSVVHASKVALQEHGTRRHAKSFPAHMNASKPFARHSARSSGVACAVSAMM